LCCVNQEWCHWPFSVAFLCSWTRVFMLWAVCPIYNAGTKSTAKKTHYTAIGFEIHLMGFHYSYGQIRKKRQNLQTLLYKVANELRNKTGGGHKTVIAEICLKNNLQLEVWNLLEKFIQGRAASNPKFVMDSSGLERRPSASGQPNVLKEAFV
jgi:hypothetical protein